MGLFVFTSMSAQKTMSYDKELASKNLSQINKLKIGSDVFNKTQLKEFKSNMSILFALSEMNRAYVCGVCITCLVSSKSITKAEGALLQKIVNAKSPSESLKNTFVKFESSSELFGAIQGGVVGNGDAPGPISYGAWGKFFGSVVGAIAGAIAAFELGPVGSVAGAAIGAKIGGDFGDALGDSISPGGNGVVARPDGSDCTGFPRS